jgi:hypothetical protein
LIGGVKYEKNSNPRDAAADLRSVVRRAEFHVANHSRQHQRPECNAISQQQQSGTIRKPGTVQQPAAIGKPGTVVEHAVQRGEQSGKRT